MAFYVYMLASGRNGTLYVGQTDDLTARVQQHREKAIRGFTARYDVARLVWFEVCADRDGALTRERQVKKWYRAWKLRTIEAANPDWRDLSDDLTAAGHPLHRNLQGWAVERQTSLDSRMRGEGGIVDA